MGGGSLLLILELERPGPARVYKQPLAPRSTWLASVRTKRAVVSPAALFLLRFLSDWALRPARTRCTGESEPGQHSSRCQTWNERTHSMTVQHADNAARGRNWLDVNTREASADGFLSVRRAAAP
jgi:hypothetical protein